MQSPVVSKSYKLRALAFATVLLISGMLVFTLLQEAQSAEIEAVVPSTVSGSSATFTATVKVPETEVLPVSGIGAAIETNEDAVTTKQSDLPVTLAEIAECPAATGTCTTGALQRTHGAGNPNGNDVVTEIRFDGFFQLGTENTVPGSGLTGNGYFVHGEGYGYDNNGGFGYQGVRNPTNEILANGYGYGDGGLEMRYTVTINPGALANGHYWFTMIADTDSSIQDGLQSAAQSFQITTSPGGGGGGGGDGNGGPDLVEDAIGIDIPEGALEAWRAVISGEAGQTIQINTGSDRIPQVDFTLDSDVTDAEVDIVVWPPGQRPDGVGELPNGVSGVYFVQITISTGGTDHSVQIYVAIPTGEMVALPEQALGMKWNSWEVLEPIDLELVDDNYEGSFTGSCCSTYAVAFDEEDPTVTLSVPDDPLSGMVTLNAEADDNVELDRVEFYAGDTMIGSDDSAPYSVDWDTAAVSPGTYNLRAVAYDAVGNEGEDTQTAGVEESDGTETPPGGGDGDDDFPWGIVLLIIAVVAVIGGAIWYFVSQKSGGGST